MSTSKTDIDEFRSLMEADLYTFACILNPNRVYGEIHKHVYKWWTRHETENTVIDNTLLLLPRDHQKSHMAAVKALWQITRDPTKSLLYISATETLAVKQLFAIKQMMESATYQRYWPNMIHKDKGKRCKWTDTEIIIDHPARTEFMERDSTILACGITKNITGLHCTDIYLDDVVSPLNAYTKDGRSKVSQFYAQAASIETTGSTQTVVGTRYHANDLYQRLLEMTEETFDTDWNVVGSRKVYDIIEEKVEIDGKFLWPRMAEPKTGKLRGFDPEQLARKYAKYLENIGQYYAQYYNNPNNPENQSITQKMFQHYDREHLIERNGSWYYKDKKLNLYAAMDFAFSKRKSADYTAIVVVGMDSDGMIYVIDIDRFKTNKTSIYFEHLAAMHSRWGLKKLRCEVSVGQAVIVSDLKDYITEAGLRLSIDSHRPTRHDGDKAERISAALDHKYHNMAVWHYRGGYIPVLEDELTKENPAHDDIKDAMACAVEICIKPRAARRATSTSNVVNMNRKTSRFGGR